MASSPSQPSFLKLEDLDNSPPLLTSSTYEDASLTSTAPQKVVVHSKPAKKRKSWGQELPEPKTTLPPRKRAKTDDEKEQRRIERIKRNRAAAHNSRERKRQETDHLAVALARANAELQAYRTHFGALPSSVVLPEVTLSTDGADTPAPSLSDAMSSRLSVDSGTTPPTPADSPLDQLIKEEPLDASFPLFPITEEEEPKSTLPLSLPLPQLDPTQHSAVSVDLPTEHEQQQQQQEQHDLLLLQQFGNSLPQPPHPQPHHHLPHPPPSSLEHFAFADHAYDASFNSPLDFSFDDFLHDDPHAASGGVVSLDLGFGAA